MSSIKRRHPKSKIWSVEPKAPSLVSLSVRDQNIPRPPKRSSSLKAAASGLKKGLSTHNLFNASAQDSLQTLHRGKHQSCSSLQVRKTRNRAVDKALETIDDEDNGQDVPIQHIDDDSSDGTLLDVVEHYWDGLSNLMSIPSMHRRNHVEATNESTANTSSETVVHSEVAGSRRPSSSLSYGTYHTALQERHHTARRLVSRVLTSVQRRKRCTDSETQPGANRVEAWMEQALPDTLLTPSSWTELQTPSVEPSLECSSKLETNIPQRMPTRRRHCPIPEQPLQEPKISARSQWPLRPRAQSDSSSAAVRRKGVIETPQPLRLRVTVKPEVTEVTMASNDRLWAVAQIHAELPGMPMLAENRQESIAVAIVLDNS